MYIVIDNEKSKYAVIKDITEIAGYINGNVRQLRKLIKESNKVFIKQYTIITPDYVQSKSNSGGIREPKQINW